MPAGRPPRPTPLPVPTVRLFLALWPGPAGRRALAAHRQQWAWPEAARLLPPARLHLTLHFLGQVPTAKLPPLTAAIDTLAASAPAANMGLSLGQAEVWSNGVAVLCPSDEPPALRRLHGALGELLPALGLPREPRPFRPHVSLARHAAGAQPPLAAPAVRLDLRSVVLVQSERGYRVLRRWPLGGGR